MLIGLDGFGKEHPAPNHDPKLGALPVNPATSPPSRLQRK